MKNKNLFNNEVEEHIDIETDKSEKKEGTAKKIVRNDYNMGTYDFENLGEIKIYSDDSIFVDDFFTHFDKKKLRELLYDVYEKSEYAEKYKDIRRVQKVDIMEIFYLFYKHPSVQDYSCIDRFTEACNFLNFDYKYVYYNLLPNEKELIVKAIDEEYGVVRVGKIKKLF